MASLSGGRTTSSGTGPVRVAYHTFGCKTNQYDTERIRQELEAQGARTAPDCREADLFVVNTCTVTNQADADARRFIRKLRRENPHVEIIAVGCSAALRAPDYQKMSGVGAVIRGHDPLEVADAARRIRPPLLQLGARTTLERMDQEPVGGDILLKRDGATRGWLKVQDGCDRRCSFCATRLARGRSTSRPPSEILREARALSRTHPELVLTGIHIGHYGRDLIPVSSLSRLVAQLLEGVPGVRFRLGSIEATEVDDLLVRLLEESEGLLASHLHMPLQSGADPVLKRMRRWHTRETYRARALEIAARIPVLGLGADIITGFPGETDADHAETVALVDELPYTYLHVFPFSPRKGTEAAGLDGVSPVPQRVSGERSRELRELGHRKSLLHRQARDGAWAKVVVEGTRGTALTGDYLRVASPEAQAPGLADRHSEASRGGAVHRDLQEGRLRWTGDHLAIHLAPSPGFN